MGGGSDRGHSQQLTAFSIPRILRRKKKDRGSFLVIFPLICRPIILLLAATITVVSPWIRTAEATPESARADRVDFNEIQERMKGRREGE